MIWIVLLLVVLLAFWAVSRLFLEGPDLSRFDQPTLEPMNDAPSAANRQTVERVEEMVAAAQRHKGFEQLTFMREAMEAMGADADLSGVTIQPVTVADRPAEWVTPADGEISGRLLYLHGGAFTMGSPRSHRVITAELARRTGLALLVLEYRLLPENKRPDGIEDVRAAYRWMLQHGPGGASQTDLPLLVAGDSAGGNLALMLIAWVRDELRAGSAELRQLDGAIALSPLTDATFASPSTRYNVDADPMLGRMAKMINRLPRSLLLWSAWLRARIPPADPQLSPVYGGLADLPPVLIQASEAEILIDDARRYANKARAAGSPVELQTWHGMVHVWQAFGRDLPESEQAFSLMAEFIERVREIRSQSDVA